MIFYICIAMFYITFLCFEWAIFWFLAWRTGRPVPWKGLISFAVIFGLFCGVTCVFREYNNYKIGQAIGNWQPENGHYSMVTHSYHLIDNRCIEGTDWCYVW